VRSTTASRTYGDASRIRSNDDAGSRSILT
jgi:hypothetical protein